MKKTLALTALAATIIGGTLLSAPPAEARGCHHSWGHNYTSYNSGYAGYGNPYNYTVNNSNYANPYLNAYGRMPLLQRVRLGLGF